VAKLNAVIFSDGVAMNERIKELAKQAGAGEWGDSVIPAMMDNLWLKSKGDEWKRVVTE
jgi:predicted alternative tryptophan synthase beta-subunit